MGTQRNVQIQRWLTLQKSNVSLERAVYDPEHRTGYTHTHTYTHKLLSDRKQLSTAVPLAQSSGLSPAVSFP